MNLTETAELLGKDRDTLRKWARQGCPHKKNGRSYEFEIAEVFDWRIAQESGDNGRLNLGDERAKLAIEQRMKLERERAVAERELIPAKEVIASMSEEIHRAKSRLLRIPKAIAVAVPRECAREAEAEAKRLINEALAELENADTITESDSQGVGSAA